MRQFSVLEGIIVAVFLILGHDVDEGQCRSGHLRHSVIGHIKRVLVVCRCPSRHIVDDHRNLLQGGVKIGGFNWPNGRWLSEILNKEMVNFKCYVYKQKFPVVVVIGWVDAKLSTKLMWKQQMISCIEGNIFSCPAIVRVNFFILLGHG